jgi:uncharacterized protein involved in outer membrane biogenesis
MKKLLKWLGIIFGGLFALLILAAILVPLFVNVDSFRPDIEKTVNEQINGKFELGKLSLSLWGQVKVQVDGFSLKDKAGNSVVAAKDVYFHVPFLSVFSGSPILTFKAKQPELQVIKDAKGKLNVMTLMKPGAAKPAEGTAAAPAEGGGAPKSLPGIVTRARLGVELTQAHLVYKDKGTDLSSEVSDLNVMIKDISLSRQMKMEVWATLDTQMGKIFHVKGPLRLDASVDPKFEGAAFQSAGLWFKANADGLVISLPGTFEKSPKIPANMEGTLKIAATEATIEKLSAVFHNATIQISGKATNLTSADPELPANPSILLDVKSNTIDLAPWNQLSPLLKDYELAGSASLTAKAWGASEKPEYSANLAVDNLTAKAPMLKAKPRIDAAIKVVTDKLENLKVTVQGPGTDLTMQGSVVSFTKPVANFAVTSKGMDLDQWIEFPKPPPKGAAPEKPASKSDAPAADLDKSLDSLRDNPIAGATKANITVAIPFIKAMNVRISDVSSKMTFMDLVAKLESFKMKVFDGSIGASSTIRLRPKRPTYDFQGSVVGLDLKKAVTSQLELFKNTVYGQADFKMAGSGTSFNTDMAIGNLAATGAFQIRNGCFASMDIARMITEASNKAVGALGGKFPGLKGKSIKVPEDRESGYESMTANFTLKNTVFDMPDFFAKVKPNQGVDLKGATTVGIKDFSLKADWQVVDTYNATQLRNISIEEQGVRVDPLFADGNNPIVLPIKVRGKLTAPEFDYTSVPEALAKVAANNVARAVKGKVEAEAKKRIAEEIQKKAPAPVQKALEGVGKKLKLGF